jgi:hypothetical protein
MGKFEEISKARELFNLDEAETIGAVKKKINALLRRWHPDKGDGVDKERHEKTTAFLQAMKIIMDYCDGYKISFSEDEVYKYLSPEEKWMKKFANDHVWGQGRKNE